MDGFRRALLVVFFLFFVGFLLSSVSPAQECAQRARTTRAADVYAHLPQYLTGKGWQGTVMKSLPVDTQLYICEDRNVDFGFSTKIWSRIVFRDGGKWLSGWTMKENLVNWAVNDVTGGPGDFSFVSAALAAEAAKAVSNAPAWTLGSAPPLAAITAEAKAPPADSNSVTLGEMGELYWPLFIAMILGMGAKACVDLLYASSKALAREHARNGLVALLVSPIVFLGFLSAGQFSTTKQTFLVLCLLAFQNGFFWQTILKRQTPTERGA